jgi:hypothetical protein
MKLLGRRFAESPLHDLTGRPFVAIGCLSFEQRCTAVPITFKTTYPGMMKLFLFQLSDPSDGVPDYRKERATKMAQNKRELEQAGVEWTPVRCDTVASEDALLRAVAIVTESVPDTVVLDITALPKRVFCFILKRLMAIPSVLNVLVTYTEAGQEGYTEQHLAADVMTPEPFPGFSGRFSDGENNLVISIGFEALEVLLPFPAPLETVRRQWNTLREIMEDDPGNLRKDSVAVIAAWDAEQVYHKLLTWAGNGQRLSLAPFGPKPHTLGMALFAIRFDASVWYTQPKVYHPEYSRGIGDSWWYAAKWQGIRCFDR